MNPIALRLSAMVVALEGAGMPEIVAALDIAEQEILRLDRVAHPPSTVAQSMQLVMQGSRVDTELDQLREMLRHLSHGDLLSVATVSFHLWSIAMLVGREGLVGSEELFEEIGRTIDQKAIAGGWVKP